jgi:hypothetical protein
LPRPLDAEGGFGLPRGRTEWPQLRCVAQDSVRQEAIDDVFGFECAPRMGADEVVRDAAAEAIAPARRIEAQQMVAIGLGIGAPKLADDAIGGHIVHGRAPDVFVMKSSTVSSAMAGLIHPGIAHIALQQNATASRMPAQGICVRCSKNASLRAKTIYKTIIIHILIAHKL